MGNTTMGAGGSGSRPSIQQTADERFPPSASIHARVVFGEQTYYALTENQIGQYTKLGWLVTVSATVAAMCLEAAFGCWITLLDPAPATTPQTTANVVMWVALALGIAIGVFSIILVALKVQGQRGWLRNTVELQQ